MTESPVFTHNFSHAYRRDLGLDCPTRADVFTVPSGYVFTVTTEETVPTVEGPFQNSGGTPFATLEEAIVSLCQYHDYPEVADYVAP